MSKAKDGANSSLGDFQKEEVDLSCFCSDPESHLSCLSFEGQGAFPSEG